MDLENEKRLAAEAAAEIVESGMVVGLGTGSTAVHAIRRLGTRVAGGLSIRAVPTSVASAELAREVGIPLTNFSTVTAIDLTLDGADEMDAALNLIKGGGGALFREKIVAAASRRLAIFADHTKRVERLGRFPLPVEVNPFGWQVVAEKIKALGAEVILRGGADSPFITDNQGYVLDCAFGEIAEPAALQEQLAGIVGVTETGLFISMATEAFVAEGGTVHRITPG